MKLLLALSFLLPLPLFAQDLGLSPITSLESIPESTLTPLQYSPNYSIRAGVGGTQSELQAELGLNMIKSHHLEAFAILDFQHDEKADKTAYAALVGTTMMYPFGNLVAPGITVSGGIQRREFPTTSYNEDLDTTTEKDYVDEAIAMAGPELRFLMGKNFYLSMQRQFLLKRDNSDDLPDFKETVRFTMYW